MQMRVLIACEFSGVVREAFAKRGHEAMSCDLLPTELPTSENSNHHIGSIEELLNCGTARYFDMLIAHPPCTRLSNSGVRWLHERNLWEEMRKAAELFRFLLEQPIKRIAIENPIPHTYAVSIIGRKYDQIIQPWQFGHGETKATCLWLSGLPKLEPTNVVEGRKPRVHHEPPSDERWKNRSRTLTGIADAMAAQWG